MDCRDVQPLLNAYCDSELDLVQHLQVEHHLAECAECAERERGLRLLQTALASAILYYRAPDALRARLQGTATPSSAPTARRRWSRATLAATAAGIVLVVAATVTAGVFWSGAAAEDRLADRVVAGHIRSLQVASHTTDVTDSNQHTVKPWFIGKLDFSPQVFDLSPNGYALTGGRLDYLTDRPVAALVYRRRQHIINVFTWPSGDDGERPVRSQHRQGFHIRSWQLSGMAYWAISDLNPQELDDFVRLLREHTCSTAP